MADEYQGRMIWREAMTKDVEKAKAFYGALFGWAFKDMPMGPEHTYTIVENAGKGIGGVMGPTPETASAPACWLAYVSVPDVDAAAAAAKAGGGQVVWGPVDIEGVGRMATIVGFDGATISVMKPTPMGETPPRGRPAVGEFCWETLTTADVAKAKAFWTSVMPWKVSSGVGMDTFAVGDGMENQVADIQTAQGPVPPNWLSFVVVEKLEPANEKVAKLGGTVMMPGIAVPGIGRIAVVLDDQGAALGLFEPSFAG